jgi:hypothetical protein
MSARKITAEMSVRDSARSLSLVGQRQEALSVRALPSKGPPTAKAIDSPIKRVAPKELRKQFDRADEAGSGSIELAGLRELLPLDITLRMAVCLMKQFGARRQMPQRSVSGKATLTDASKDARSALQSISYCYEIDFSGFTKLAKAIDLSEVEKHRQHILEIGQQFSTLASASASASGREISKVAFVAFLEQKYDHPREIAEQIFDSADDDLSESIEIEEFVALMEGLEHVDDKCVARIARIVAETDTMGESQWHAFAESSPWIKRQNLRLATLRRERQREARARGSVSGAHSVADVFNARAEARADEVREQRRVESAIKGAAIARYTFAKLASSEIGIYDVTWVHAYDAARRCEIFFSEKTGVRQRTAPAGVEWVRSFDEFGWICYRNMATGASTYNHPHKLSAMLFQ